MYDPPSYLWALTIVGIIAMLAATTVVLYRGAVRADLGQRRAALLALPAGIGDIAADARAASRAQGAGGGAALWFNAFALTRSAVTAYQLIHVTVPGH
jgi:hypothetical protein